MAKQKKARNKKYNPMATLSSIESEMLRQTWVVGGTFMSEVDVNMNVTRGKHLPKHTSDAMCSNVARALSKRRLKWTLLAVSCNRDADGKMFMDSVIRETDKPMLAECDEMTDILHDLRTEVVKNANPKYLVSVMYVTVPDIGLDHDILLEQSRDLFVAKKAFDAQDVDMLTRLKYIGLYPNTFADLKANGKWANLGDLVRHSILGC